MSELDNINEEQLSMYEFYFRGESGVIALPVAPSKFTNKIGNKNKTVDLVSMGEVNILKDVGLREFSFKILLPGVEYPFAKYDSGFKPPLYFLNKFREYKENKKPIKFTMVRKQPGKQEPIFGANVQVSFEDYTVEENAGEEGDFWVDIRLKEYREPKVRYLREVGVNPKTGAIQVVEEIQRPSRPVPDTYTVKKGDSLMKIAKLYLNDSGKHRFIQELNGIKDPNKIYPGQVLRLK